MNFEDIPYWFIKKSLTLYQAQSIEIKYAIYQYVEESNNKLKAFEELESIVNLSANHIRDIYYAIKKQ